MYFFGNFLRIIQTILILSDFLRTILGIVIFGDLRIIQSIAISVDFLTTIKSFVIFADFLKTT